MTEVHLQLLGRFQVRRDGVEVPPAAFGGRKVRTLLRVLAVRAPDLVPHEVLAEALWPDRLPADPPANLGVLVNRARRALGDTVIRTGSGGYALGEAAVDVAEFLAAVRSARAAGEDQVAAQRACAAALALWGEPLAEDTYSDWAREPRQWLHRAWVDACEGAATAALALGDARGAVARAAEAVAAEPLRESAALVLGRALAAAGDPAAALCRLAELRERLADELGIDPSTAFAELELALLRGQLPATVRMSAPVPGPAPRFADMAFVGRDGELARMRAAIAERGVVRLAGGAGVGKSRLLAELAREPSLPVVAARAFQPERAEAWGLARSLLREALAADEGMVDGLPERVRDALADLLPEWGERPGAALDGESRRALLLAGGLRVLQAATGDGALLVVDDLQWADPSSLVLVGSVLARLPRLAAVLAYRPDEVPDAAIAGVRGARAGIDVELGPLPVEAVHRLAGDPGLGRALGTETDRTPFAVAEVLREMSGRGVIAPTTGGGWALRSPDAVRLAASLGRSGQRRAVRARAQRQTGPRADVLALLALLARETPASTLGAAAGLGPREVLDALSALAAAGLVRLGERGWATAHDLVGETVTAGLGAGERGRWHGLLASALEAEDADPSETARHHREAGAPESAALSFATAACRALDAHATREAATLSGAGLALDPHPPVRADLLAVRADAQAAHGELTAAVADLRSALAGTGTGPVRARRLARLAMLTFGAHDPVRAAELAELALVEAGGDGPARAVALETAAVLDMNLARPQRSRDRSEDALRLHHELGDARGVARILDSRAMATFLDGQITAGVDVFGRVARLFTDSGELLRVVTPRSTRGHGLVFGGRPEAGLADASAALRLARDLDAPEGRAYALWHRSEALSALGRADEAEADAREALTVAGDVGHRGWTATAHRALGIALAARGEPDAAAAAFTASAEVAGDALTLFASWAAARSALTAVARGRLDGCDELVGRALSVGPPLGHYEARLSEVELAATRGDPRTGALAATALERARAGGHEVSAARLAAFVPATDKLVAD